MPISTDKKKIEELLTRGVEEVIEKDHLTECLASGKKLRIKFGIDPTGSELHFGHSVPLRKLRAFQDAGHTAILLIGDYTAMIGDPTGRDSTRPILSLKEVKQNMKTYLAQAGKILNMNTLEVRYNSEWYAGPILNLFMELSGKITVARVLDRADFKKRMEEGHDIQMQEILYPLLQGYDSVALNADIELGGTDQKFNLLMGRKIQSRYGQKEQDVMMFPLLVGTDGGQKMSKTHNNYIGLFEKPESMFGKLMSIPDDLIIKYFALLTDVPIDIISSYAKEMKKGKNPKDVKMTLAHHLVRIYHNISAADDAQTQFVATFVKKQTPDEMSSLAPSAYDIVTVLVEAGFVSSNSDARRAILGGGVRVNDEKVSSYDYKTKKDDVVQKGKRFFVRIS